MLFLIVLSASLVSCAERGPLALHAEIVVPPPDDETCHVNDAGGSQVHVIVGDELGALFPDVAVYAAPMRSHGGLVTATTNDEGLAVVEVPSPGDYAITVVIGGFVPQVRALQLRPGCVGTTRFTLQVGFIVVEE